MKRVKLVIAYDGTAYCGWQQQPNGVTIEEVLNRELSRLLGEQIQVIGASRTDSGVHARGNIAVFDTSARMPADKICIALNQRLPGDIVIQSSCEVAPDWHPRKCNSRKTYEYRILNRRVPLPDQRFNSYFYYYDLDVEKMRRAAEYLVGEHDFKSFCSIRTQVEDTVRRIYEIRLTCSDDRIDIRISGNGFLYNMVRIIVGSLIKVGCGFWEPEHMKEVLEARERSQAGPKAPAHGLTLVSIEEEELQPYLEERNEHWAYRLNQADIQSYGQAYIRIYSCEERDFDRLLLRLVKQCSRNGAQRIHVRDDTGHLERGYEADYFCFRTFYCQWRMTRKLTAADEEYTGRLRFEAVTGEVSEEYRQLENACFAGVPGGHARTGKELLEDISKGEQCFLVYDQDRTAGMLSLRICQQDECMEIEAVGIREELRGRGYGKECLTFAHSLARRAGCRRLQLVCADSNPAIKLYESYGYRREACLSSWYVTWDEKHHLSEETGE